MATAKLSAIKRIITSRNFTLITLDNQAARAMSHGKGDLEDAFLLAITLKALYDSVQKQIEEQAAEGGELHALEALRKATDKVIENGGE